MPVFRSSRKVQLFGSSLAVTIPALFVKACEIEKGAEVNILYDLDDLLVVWDQRETAVLRVRLRSLLEKLEEKNGQGGLS